MFCAFVVNQFNVRRGDVSSASASLEEHQPGSCFGCWLALPAHRSSPQTHTIPLIYPHRTPKHTHTHTHTMSPVCKRTPSILTVINSDII